MKVGILGGGGAMGGLFGAYLAEAGNDVTLIDVSSAAVDAINAQGLIVEEKNGDKRAVKVPASSNPASVGPAELVVNFVKCYHTEAAIRLAQPLIGPQTTVLSLQNGWGNADRIAALVGRERVLVGLTYHSATLVTPGQIRHPSSGPTSIGELDGTATQRARRIVDLFQVANLQTALSENILQEIWKKLALNVCTLPTAALMGFRAHELVEHGGVMDMMRALLGEVVTVARSEGISLDFDERWSAIVALLRQAIGGKPSMLQDVEARRRTEIDVINGAIVAAGRKHKIVTPYNDTMVWLVRSLEETFVQPAAVVG
jgi:2-dehydropantoate 2-reductase